MSGKKQEDQKKNDPIQDTPALQMKTPINFEKRLMQDKETTQKAVSKLYCVSVVSVFFIIAQLIGGWLSGSIAIFADSAHLASDLLGFGIAIAGVKLSTLKADKHLSFGWHRAELVGTLVSIASIWIMTVWLLKEATGRFFMEPMVQGKLMFIVAVMGLIFNLIQIKILHSGDTHFHLGEGFHAHDHEEGEGHDHDHGHSHGHDHGHSHGHSHGHDHGEEGSGNMNIDGATLHVLGDLIMSIGVIIASIIIYVWPHLWYADPICTYIFSVIVSVTTVPIFKKCLSIMMEGTPDEVNIEELHSALMESDPKNIVEMHDLHVWKLGGEKLSMSCHIKTKAPLKTLARVTDVCRRKFNLYHTTIQVEGLSDQSNPHHFECDQDVHENYTIMQTDQQKKHEHNHDHDHDHKHDHDHDHKH